MACKKFSLVSGWLPLVLLMTLLPICASGRVYSGQELFLMKYTYLVKGKRVGLITNPTGVDAYLRATIDLFKSNRQVNLVGLFAPEHGVRGNVRAGEQVRGGRDAATGLPVYTLYGGRDHKPTPAALAKVDVLIYDIQDVGSRAYTYIWHLAECMSAAASAGKTVIVLDRPNPLGAKIVDGPVSEKKYLSFIGLYPIPRVYGMTVGELARYLNKEEGISCRLIVIPMGNYKRGMSWAQTELPWVPPSPHIPTPEAACCFAATGTIGELGFLNIGVGYTLPFQTVAAPWLDGPAMARYMNSLRLTGVRFRPIYYKPYYGAYKGQEIQGVQIHVTDPASFYPTTTETALLCFVRKYYPRYFKVPSAKAAQFNKAMGTAGVLNGITRGRSYRQIAAGWRYKQRIFEQKRKKYLIYK